MGRFDPVIWRGAHEWRGAYVRYACFLPAPPRISNLTPIRRASPMPMKQLGRRSRVSWRFARMESLQGAGDKTWHAYLSTQARNGAPAVNARDRIGMGPWYNSLGQPVSDTLSELHGDTLEEARVGNNFFKQSALTERGKA